MAQNTNYEFVQGKLSDCYLVRPHMQFGKWIVILHPTPDSLEKIRDWQGRGMKNVLKKDEDGYYTRFGCPVQRERKNGTMWAFEAPVVVDKDNRPMDGSIVGNGSDGTLKLEVYEHGTPGGGKAIAARLVGVRIENLVKIDAEEAPGADGYKDLRETKPLF
jgi:hypothetical protein